VKGPLVLALYERNRKSFAAVCFPERRSSFAKTKHPGPTIEFSRLRISLREHRCLQAPDPIAVGTFYAERKDAFEQKQNGACDPHAP